MGPSSMMAKTLKLSNKTIPQNRLTRPLPAAVVEIKNSRSEFLGTKASKVNPRTMPTCSKVAPEAKIARKNLKTEPIPEDAGLSVIGSIKNEPAKYEYTSATSVTPTEQINIFNETTWSSVSH